MAERHTYNLSREETVGAARSIAREYANDDLILTLRQLYYQFVSRGLEANGQHVYDRLGATLTKARYEGTFPISWLEDRGRDTGEMEWATNKDSVQAALHETRRAIQSCPYWYLERSKWWGQRELVSVWVEKEALSGVFADPCERHQVPLFACKGYPSVSALWSWLAAVMETRTAFFHAFGWSPKPVILYFGDHDPDGIEIPRSALNSLYKLLDLKEDWFTIEVERMALTLDQVATYDPPPFPAKTTSARYRRYFDEYGIDDAWELDALEPRVLRDLVDEGVARHFDEEVCDQMQHELHAMRNELREQITDPTFIDSIF